MARLWRVKDSQKGREWERVSEERLVDWINKGLLKSTDLVTPQGEESWRPAKDVPELRSLLGGAVEESPPPVVRRVGPRASRPPKVRAKPVASPARKEVRPKARAEEPAVPRRERPPVSPRSGRRFGTGAGRALSSIDPEDFSEESELELTPMIDVTFLLLIFFMVTATLSEKALVLTPEAESGLGVPPDHKILICITRDEGGQEEMFFQDPPQQPFDLNNLRGLFQERLLRHSARDVIIKADGGVDFGKVQKVMDVVSSFDAGRLLIGVREKQ